MNFDKIFTKLFIRVTKLNISLVFLSQSYYKVQEDVILNTTHFFIMYIPNRQDVQQIVINHSSDIDLKYFTKLYQKCAAEPYSFLVIDTIIPSDNALNFQKNLIEEVYRRE